ncbi:hypothetical protein F5Y12DRAFT_718988 [Xylaria sp. FL1777]|nr:hypothetical protein F5Y12DRAFT_718988 [Xylaria sp. FL1777]
MGTGDGSFPTEAYQFMSTPLSPIPGSELLSAYMFSTIILMRGPNAAHLKTKAGAVSGFGLSAFLCVFYLGYMKYNFQGKTWVLTIPILSQRSVTSRAWHGGD